MKCRWGRDRNGMGMAGDGTGTGQEWAVDGTGMGWDHTD